MSSAVAGPKPISRPRQPDDLSPEAWQVALWYAFIARVAGSGVAPAVAKSLARHSTIVLTMDHYTHTLIEDERAALDRLPAIRLGDLRRVDVRATGT